METLKSKIQNVDWENLDIDEQHQELEKITDAYISRTSKWSDIILCLDCQKETIEDEYGKWGYWQGKQFLIDPEGSRRFVKATKANLLKIDKEESFCIEAEMRWGTDEPTGIFASIDL